MRLDEAGLINLDTNLQGYLAELQRAGHLSAFFLREQYPSNKYAKDSAASNRCT